MVRCEYKKCKNIATVEGSVLARNPDGGPDTFMKVYACEKHKEVRGFFYNKDLDEEQES